MKRSISSCGLIILFTVALVILSLVILSGHQNNYINQDNQKEYKLRKMMQMKDENSRLREDFFLILGSISGESKTEIKIVFSWESEKDTYAITSIPITLVKIKLDENIQTPTVRFFWKFNSRYHSDYDRVTDDLGIKGVLDYALITCRSEQYPEEINLPLNSNIEGLL